MEGRQSILGLFPDMGRKSGHRAGIPRFQEGEGVKITFCGGVVILLCLERFEGAYHFAPPPEHKITNWSPARRTGKFAR